MIGQIGQQLRVRQTALLVIVCSMAFGLFAQDPLVLLEQRLPTLDSFTPTCKEIMGRLELGLVPYTAHRMEVGSKARDQFSKPIPQSVPAELTKALAERRQEFRQLFEMTKSAGSLTENGEKVLREFAEVAQKSTERTWSVGVRKARTPLMVLLTDHTGEMIWCLFQLVVVDAPALLQSAVFTAEVSGDNKLIVTIMGRDVERTRLATADVFGYAVTEKGYPNLGFLGSVAGFVGECYGTTSPS